MILAFAASWALVGTRSKDSWSPLVVFGQTSLFVYWIHVEIAYGIFTYPIHRSLPLSVSFPAYVVLMLCLLGVAVLWQRRGRGPLIPAHLRAASQAQRARFNGQGSRVRASGPVQTLESSDPRTVTSRLLRTP